MTISTIYAPTDHTTVAAGPYSFLWDVVSADDVQVSLDGTPLTAGQFSVSLSGVAPPYGGGSVKLASDPGSGRALQITRLTPRTQQVDYSLFNGFPVESHELAIDKLTLIAQELDVTLGSP
ncbi:MAG: hypothetical protein ACYTF6_12035 [Planctomycetota bacterium]|jgi:hypothetical protein